LAALDDERYGANALARAHDAAASAGYTLRRVDGRDDGPDRFGDRLAAWIDLHFAPSWWSYEALAGSAWVAERGGEIAGFAAFGARGLKFPWLRRWRERADVGIFGPYGVAPAHRKTGVGEALLAAAMCGLRGSRYDFALIPAVSGERLIEMYVRRTDASVVDEFGYDVGRFRATILASGAGTNARSVLERVRDGKLPLDIAAVIANKSDAGALDAAREHGVPAIPVVWNRASASRTGAYRAHESDAGETRTGESRAAYDSRVIEAVAATEPQLVLLLGWMHLLPPAFLRRFPETINVHPSFLPLDPAADAVVMPDATVIPALRGAHALRDALRAGLAWTGATVHYVTESTDRGAVLVRTPLPVGDATTEEALRDRIRPTEFAVVAAAIRRWTFER
ncbi:MAG: phosphoribosylglycinamide formyltransferase 1, partial [Candidatus Eremiobacteraeota bacterium]|nr:phosphoribosylglycinamide formyltransferase 1 [Candidatus Eremiobacteraeota bacterium]